MAANRGEDRKAGVADAQRAWLALVRLPNLPTVPGDPIAGLVLSATAAGRDVSVGTAAAVAISSLCLYVAGLILNDLHDVADDSRLRPERPLAAGLISPSQALKALGAFTAVGLFSAALAGPEVLLAALALAVLIVTYNLIVKEDASQACVCMGLCRGASMMVGAAAGGAPATVLLPAACLAGAVASITAIARREDRVQMIGAHSFVPAAALGLGWLSAWIVRVWSTPAPATLASLVLAAVACGSAFGVGLVVFGRESAPATTRRMIGRLIALLLPWQASLAVIGGTPGAWLTAVLLIIAWPFSRLASRVFSAS